MERRVIDLTTFLCAVLYIISLTGCSSLNNIDSGNTVDVTEKCDSSDIFGKYICVDKLYPVCSGNIFISSVDKIVSHKSNVYILDKQQESIFVFNTKNNKLSLKLKKLGHSKQEYIGIEDFTVNDRGQLVIYDSNIGKINWYNNKNECVKSIQVTTGGKSFALASDGKIAIDCAQREPGTSVIVYNIDGSVCSQIHQERLYDNLKIHNEQSITWDNKDVIFTRPYDYSIYRYKNGETERIISLDFAESNYDFNKLKTLPYPDFQKQLHATNKVLYLEHLNIYKGLVFITTNNMQNILYDTKSEKSFILSNIKEPYDVLFLSPLYVNSEGTIYTYIRSNNIDDALRPTVEYYKENNKFIPQYLSKPLSKHYDNVSFWLLKAHVK